MPKKRAWPKEIMPAWARMSQLMANSAKTATDSSTFCQ